MEVLVRPHRFFRANVAPGDQAPGLTFLAVVVFATEATRHVLTPEMYGISGDLSPIWHVFWLLAAVIIVAPAGVHLIAAVQTLALVPTAPERAGVSETVQVLCYATAPCLLAGIPNPWLRSACVLYGAALYVYGLHVVHDVSVPRAAVVGALPAILTFGVGFRGYSALSTAADAVQAALAVV